MKKVLVACSAGVAIAVAALLTGTLLGHHEPVYQGKTISQWIVELPSGQRLNAFGMLDPETPARKVLRSIGTNAVPFLARAMVTQQGGTFVTDFKSKLWFHSTYLQNHFSRPVYALEIRRAAAGLLTEMITKNPEVAHDDQIIRAFSKLTGDKDGNLRIMAVATLGILAIQQQSRSATSALILALDSPEEGVRSHAAWKLSDGGPAQKQALPALNRKLSDTSDAVRINAALAVYRIGNQTNEAVAVLVGALRSNVGTDRGNAAYHLSLIGPAAKGAVPALELQAKETDEYARKSARTALLKIDPEHYTGENKGARSVLSRVLAAIAARINGAGH